MTFDTDHLTCLLEDACPEVIFALLHGSARDGVVCAGSDIDLALYVQSPPSLELYQRVHEQVARVTSEVECDMGILNRAEPIYRFEALKGRLLFCRDQETYLRFFSLTCREYDSQIASYHRQKTYRLNR